MNTERTEAAIKSAASAIALGATEEEVRISLVESGFAPEEALLVLVAAKLLG